MQRQSIPETRLSVRTETDNMIFPPMRRRHWREFNAVLARVDWQCVYIVTARFLISVGMLAVTYQLSIYLTYFGAAAIALLGQYLIGVFFTVAAFSTEHSGQLMTAAVGMYLLVNTF